MSVSPGIVMDPSCGDGRFLAQSGEHGASGLIGCDLDPEAVSQTRQLLMGCGRCGSAALIPLKTIQDLGSCALEESGGSGVEISPDPNMTLGLAYLDTESRTIWTATTSDAGVAPLRQLGEIANGYVGMSLAPMISFAARILTQSETPSQGIG
jgi:hypothetical protein